MSATTDDNADTTPLTPRQQARRDNPELEAKFQQIKIMMAQTQAAAPFIGNSIKTGDFTNYFQPGEDFYNASPQGNSNRPTLTHLQAASQRTIGVGYRITRKVAENVARNQFYFAKKGDKKQTEVEKPEIFEWFDQIDFWNQLVDAMYYDSSQGVGFSIKFFKEDMSDDLSKPPPKNTRWVKQQTLPPTYFYPTNTWAINGIDYNEEEWEFRGGRHLAKKVHRDRVHVWMSHKTPEDWRGVSDLEPIWTSLMAYYNSMIFLVRGIAKWGNSVPVVKMGKTEPSTEYYAKMLAIVQEFIANSVFIVGREDAVEFHNPQLGAGLTEFIEFLKEDISAGSGIPLNFLFGRSESGGIGGEGALTSERQLLQLYATKQQSYTDDVLRLCSQAGFDVGKLTLVWNLALQKTTEQRIRENILEEQLEQSKVMTKQMKVQTKILEMQEQQMQLQVMGMMMGLMGEEVGGEPGKDGETPNKKSPDTNKDGRISTGEAKSFTQKSHGLTRKKDDFVVRELLYEKFMEHNEKLRERIRGMMENAG